MTDLHQNAPALRPLDGLEKAFWLLDQNIPTHFCMAAHVIGRTSVEDWRSALDTVGRQSTLIASQILVDAAGQPFFSAGRPRAIPLKIASGADDTWTDDVSDELEHEFDVAVDSLVRAVLLHRADRSILVLSFHHSVADGTSAEFLIRDVLRATSGEDITRQDNTLSLERALLEAGFEPIAQPSSGEAADRPPPGYRPASNAVPLITAEKLSEAATTRLRQRSRQEGATVHGALCAAATLAFPAVPGNTGIEAPRVFTPISVRSRLLRNSEQLGIYVNGVTTSVAVSADRFWDGAREFSRRTRSLDDAGALTAAVLGVRAVMAATSTKGVAADLWASVFGAEICVTNLAAIDIPTAYNGLFLEGLWGPAVSLGIDNEQTLGAVTINGQLHLLHTTFVRAGRFMSDFLSTLEASVRS